MNVFGFLWSKYYTKSENDGFEPFYDRLQEYALQNLPLGPGDEMFGTVTRPRKWHSIRTASDEFELSHKLTRKLTVASGLVEETEVRKSQNTILFDAKKFDAYIGRIRGSVSKDEALEYLNLPRPHEQGMMKSGFLAPIIRRGDALGHHLFEKEVLDQFLNKLLQDALPVDQLEEGFSDIPGAAFQSFASVVEVVELLFAGRLKNVRFLKSSRGFLSVLVKSDEIVALLHEAETRGYTALELNSVLGANSVSVRALIRHGFLASTMHKNAKTGYVRPLVAPRDVEEFQRKYIGSFEIGPVSDSMQRGRQEMSRAWYRTRLRTGHCKITLLFEIRNSLDLILSHC
ncbi:hypothetical protein GF108_19540 [Phyllobacterium sp. SYP-B3895]|uniref:hypothetical protein n=1 Tax=Phyllobacterium sp. SYP-B3895 TaxID=2663240 RepID=UPI001299B5C8|nr:hypothetical protein [Phyllobacterium sp. SYP-B3895]MRG57767.1 hypothetical protein [Phyllobacterium sp. SYP-B3895]